MRLTWHAEEGVGGGEVGGEERASGRGLEAEREVGGGKGEAMRTNSMFCTA